MSKYLKYNRDEIKKDIIQAGKNRKKVERLELKIKYIKVGLWGVRSLMKRNKVSRGYLYHVFGDLIKKHLTK